MEETKRRRMKQNDADDTAEAASDLLRGRDSILPPPPPPLPPPPPSSLPQKPKRDRIVLCIGGQFLQTSAQTLCVDSQSMLAAWVLRHLDVAEDEEEDDGDDDDDGDVVVDDDFGGGEYDRSGNTNGGRKQMDDWESDLRRGRDSERRCQRRRGKSRVLWIDRDARRFRHVLNYLRNGTLWLDDVASLRAVQEEASFFGIHGLEALCEERIQEQEASMRKKGEELKKAIQDAIAEFWKESGIFLENSYHHNLLRNGSNKGEILAILRGRRLGSSDSVSDEPVFRMDEDF